MKDHFHDPLLKTPFHDRTSAACKLNQWGAWAGYTTPIAYCDEAMEYTAIRNAASLYDLCPMIKYRISGPDSGAYLNRLTLRDAAKLPVGAIHYTAWTDDEGKLLDDGTLFRLAAEDYRLCCQERHLPWLLDSSLSYDVQVIEETSKIASLALQGPTSAAVLRIAGFDITALKPFRMASFPFRSGKLLISRTGFTADLGYELWISPDLALPLWDMLMQAGALHGLRPIGSNALNVARIEAGFIIANMDFIPTEQTVRPDRSRSPYELGLDWMIDWTKGQFTGRQALARERDQKSSRWALVALDIQGNVSAEGSLIYENKTREVGYITAAAWSPTTKRNIALAQVTRSLANSRSLWVEIYALRELQYHKLMVKADVTARPFFSPPRRRATPPLDF